jgi:hypothetical protein
LLTKAPKPGVQTHIVNDLPQTLQDMGYPEATDCAFLTQVFDSFNQSLMEEKPEIMKALAGHYGSTDIAVLDKILAVVTFPLMLFSKKSLADQMQLNTFAAMRTIARERAVSLKPEQIHEQVLPLSDAVQKAFPGGN